MNECQEVKWVITRWSSSSEVDNDKTRRELKGRRVVTVRDSQDQTRRKSDVPVIAETDRAVLETYRMEMERKQEGKRGPK